MQLPPPTFSISQGKSSQANDKGLNDGDGDSDSEIGAGNNGDETANNGNNRKQQRRKPFAWDLANNRRNW